ncbi:hypothetical protein FRC14_002614 [Serendipita sp. 396]|nr:hypothetical protein FRC14_002614 [Serendipita sp. 396]KAG8784619.1 hypothetical protein FRC15_002936 [Serendipita sp. 397]KAG8800200.1 hypothetical protein FRC16_003414 [Serendipita sp. 398]KAG8819927.1 hypothetical protein FRC19_009381 [Serendipita sp. 401]KAG8834906.1 hypothetical protein FRC18_001335 [Serendipita sp. 400]KAG8868250.1 hypothetical protein FRC20_003728 [Serendipita sp. 405]KAG9052911.1 hypothetical protein FS842_009049 [Serendipita sp. 407]
MAGSATSTYTLICLLVGDDDTFSVKISNAETFQELKYQILQHNRSRFRKVDLPTLRLYKSEITIGPGLKKRASEFIQDPEAESARVYSNWPISMAFPTEPESNKVHIVANCHTLGYSYDSDD